MVGNGITFYSLCETYVYFRDLPEFSNIRIVNLYDAEIVPERVIRTLQKNDMYIFGILIDTYRKLNFTYKFDNCDFETLVSNRSLDNAFDGYWQVENTWNITTGMITVTTYSANCSLAVTVHNINKTFEFIVTDVPRSAQAFGMNAQRVGEYEGDLVEGERVTIQCITQKYDVSKT